MCFSSGNKSNGPTQQPAPVISQPETTGTRAAEQYPAPSKTTTQTPTNVAPRTTVGTGLNIPVG